MFNVVSELSFVGSLYSSLFHKHYIRNSVWMNWELFSQFQLRSVNSLSSPSLLRQASEHSLNLWLAAGFTHKIKKTCGKRERKCRTLTMIGRKSLFLQLWKTSLYVLFAGRLLRLPSGTMWIDISLPVTIASRLTTHLAVPYGRKRPLSQVALHTTQYPWSSSRVHKGWRPLF